MSEPARASCQAVLPSHLIATEVQDPVKGSRVTLTDPITDRAWMLGHTEYRLALAFDGKRSLAEIGLHLTEITGATVSVERIAAFERRLLDAGLLQSGGEERLIDPFTGFHFRTLHHLVILRLWSCDPDPWAEKILAHCPRGFGRVALVLIGLCAALVPPLLALDWTGLLADAERTLDGWGWAVLYLLTLASGIVHEGGHILACRAQGVRVRETGFAIYFLLPFAWTRPDSRQWENLPLQGRVLAILAGPLASLALAGLGLGARCFLPEANLWDDLAVYAILAGLFGGLVTLLPIINGDGYLLIVELFGLPNLRRRAFQYMGQVLRGRPADPAAPRLLYLLVSLGTVAGWALLWLAMAGWLVGSMYSALGTP